MPEIRANLLSFGVALQDVNIALSIGKRRAIAQARKDIRQIGTKLSAARIHVHVTYTWVEKIPNDIEHKFTVDAIVESARQVNRCAYIDVEFLLDRSSPVQSKWTMGPGDINIRLSPEGETEDILTPEMEAEMQAATMGTGEPRGGVDKQLTTQDETDDLLRKIFGKDIPQ
jgi:hypothetical protein